ncbi:MAG: NACHT domain-containing protein [Candidatus Eremiobacterota bacterium]
MFFSSLTKESSYYIPYRQIIDWHAGLWALPHHPHFTLHGPQHAETIINKLSKWLENVPLSHLNLLDTFLLKVAIYLHDIGMQSPPGPILNEVINYHSHSGYVPYSSSLLEAIRAKHHILSRKMVEGLLNHQNCCQSNVNTFNIRGELLAIALLCEGHAISNINEISSEITNIYKIYLPQETNLSRLLYLLRLGDAMDAGQGRVNNHYIQQYWPGLLPNDKFHTWKHWFVSHIDITGAGVVTFNYTIPCEYENLIPDITTCAEAPLQDAILQMELQLRQWNVFTPVINRLIDITDRNVHLNCPLGNDGWTIFNRVARKIRERREPEPMGAQRRIDICIPVVPDEWTGTLIIDDEKHVFVPVKYSFNKEEKNLERKQEDLVSFCKSVLLNKQVPLILGFYGMGKSYFSRRFLYEVTEDIKQTTPRKLAIIIPLRTLHYTRAKNTDLLEAVLNVIDPCKNYPFDREDFRKKWRNGQLLLIFDGLDEIPYIYHDKMADKWMNELITCKGNNDAVVTCRTGLLSEAMLRNENISPLYLQKWDFSDFECYVNLCSGFVENPATIIQIVSQQAGLKDMASRPLYARMIVEIDWNSNQLKDKIINEYILIDHFVYAAFERKKHLSVYKDNIDAKIECLITIAGYFFRIGRSFASMKELKEIVLTHTWHTTNDIYKFFESEISVYSLMKPVGESLMFSHDTICDYFIVRYIERIWIVEGEDTVAGYLNRCELSGCAIRFFVQQFYERSIELRQFASKLQKNGPAIISLLDNM